ncbi:MAG: protein kinase [Pirellulaceae bacterium]
MTTSTADRNLLFGILAMQMNFIDRDRLIEAMHAWLLEKSTPLGRILLARGALSEETFGLIDALVEKHLEMHGGDPEKSLATVSSIGSVRDDLKKLDDDELNATLAHVSATRYTSPVTDSNGGESNGGEHRNHGPRGHRYRIVRPYAKGGLGQVSVAQDEELHREVALKELQDRLADDHESRTRFILEAEITGGLEHPGIVPVYGLGCYADGRPFYAMRFIRGDSLKEAVDRFYEKEATEADEGERALELRKLLGRFVDVCNAIQYAHSRGVLHRDLKPGNIMLGKYGETLVVDWGLAKPMGRRDGHGPADEATMRPASAAESSATQMGAAVGTPAYMSPEQAAGRLDELGPASDVYSLGATLYHVLTGRPPFRGGPIADLLNRVEQGQFEPPRQVNRGIPKALNSICLKAMARRPADRYASPQEMADDVEKWMADEPVSALPESLTERAARWMRRHRSWTLAAGAALVLVTAVSIAATLLVNAAREKEATLRRLTERLRTFDVRVLEEQQRDTPLSAEALVELEQQLDAIRQLSPEDEAVRRAELLDQFADGAAQLLQRSRYGDDDDVRFMERLALLQERQRDMPELADRIARLLEDRQARLAVWDPLFELAAPLDADTPLFASDQVEVADARLRRQPDSGAEYETILTTAACPPGKVEIRGTFDQSWVLASHLGLALNASDGHRYEFLVAVPDFHYRDRSQRDLARLPALQQIIKKLDNPQVKMLVLRDGQLLRESPLLLEPGRLTLAARREGGTLSFTINDVQTIQSHDPYPLPNNVGGVFGVVWPRPVQIESLAAYRQRSSTTSSPLELGDALFAERKYREAQDEYRKLGDESEPLYKIALCYEFMRDFDAYTETLEKVAVRIPDDERALAAGQWHLLANVRLLQSEIADNDWVAVGARMRELSIYHDFQDVGRLLPATEREKILANIRRDGQRFRVVFEREANRSDIEAAQQLDEFFNEDETERRALRWRVADMHRVEGDRQKAMEIVADMIDDKPGVEVPVRERIALVADLAWMLRLEGRSDDALREIERWLVVEGGDANGPPEYNEEYLPLLLERARMRIVANQLDEAENDLEVFFDRVPVERQPYSEFANACLLKGMVEERRVDPEDPQRPLRKAREQWLKGARRYWHAGYLSPRDIAGARGVESIHVGDALGAESIIASWTQEITNDEAVMLMHNFVAGSGTGDTAVKRMLPIVLPPEFLRAIVLRLGQEPRVREYQRRSILNQLTLRETCLDGMTGILYVAVNLSAFDGKPYSKELDAWMFAQARNIVESFERGDIKPADMRTILELWRGNYTRRGWENLRDEIDADLAASMAQVFGRMHVRHKKPEIAEQFFRYVLEHQPSSSPLHGDAKLQLEELKSSAG